MVFLLEMVLFPIEKDELGERGIYLRVIKGIGSETASRVAPGGRMDFGNRGPNRKFGFITEIQ